MTRWSCDTDVSSEAQGHEFHVILREPITGRVVFKADIYQRWHTLFSLFFFFLEASFCDTQSIVAVCNESGEGRFVTISNTPSCSRAAAEDDAGVIDSLCYVRPSGLPPPGHYRCTSPAFFSSSSPSSCWRSLLVLQIDLLIFQHMLWC